MQAKDILGGGIGFGQGKGSEEAVAEFSGILEAQAGDLAGGGVDLMVIVAVELVAQDAADLFQGGEVLEGTGADDAILQPAVRAFHLALGLRGEGIGDIHSSRRITWRHCGSMSSVWRICLRQMAVPVLNKAEDPQIVHVVAQRQSIGLHHGLRSLNMGPGGLLRDKIGVEQLAAVIIHRGDQGPFLLRKGRPKMGGGIVLDQGSDGRRDHFPVMDLPFGWGGRLPVPWPA